MLAIAVASLATTGCAAEPDDETGEASGAVSGGDDDDDVIVTANGTKIFGAAEASAALTKAAEKLAGTDRIAGDIYVGGAAKSALAGMQRRAFFPHFEARDVSSVSAKVYRNWSRSVGDGSRTLIASDAATLNQFVAPTPMIANGRTVYLDTATDCVQRLQGVLKPSADDALLVESGVDDVAATADEIVVGLMAPQSDRLVPLVARFIVDEKLATIGTDSFSASTAVEAELVSAVRRLLQQRGMEFSETKAPAANLVARFVTMVVE